MIATNKPKLPRCTIENLKGEHKRHTSLYTPTLLGPSVPWDSRVSNTSLCSPITPPATSRRILEQGRATGSNVSKLFIAFIRQGHSRNILSKDFPWIMARNYKFIKLTNSSKKKALYSSHQLLTHKSKAGCQNALVEP